MKHKTYKNSRVLTDSPSVSKREVEFPGGPVVRTPVWFGLVWFYARGAGWNPQGTEVSQKKKKKVGLGGEEKEKI